MGMLEYTQWNQLKLWIDRYLELYHRDVEAREALIRIEADKAKTARDMNDRLGRMRS